jgi:hypothetical protein
MNATPKSLIERAANAAMDAAEKTLTDEGYELDKLYVALNANGAEGERDACAAIRGTDDAREILAFLMSEAISVGKRLGVEIQVMPMDRPQAARDN